MRRPDFYDALRQPGAGVFAGSLTREQVAGIEGILDAMQAVGDGRAKTLAYALATAYHETGRKMVPVREGFASSDEGAIRAVAALARKRGADSAPARYGKPTGPYGKAYYGRGHVQLTWRENYVRSSEDAGIDLERDPDAMLDPVVSARILIKGLVDGRWNGAGRGLAYYLPDDGDDNLKDARRTVNGTDRWDAIAGHYAAFHAAIEAAGGWCSDALTDDALADEVPAERRLGASLADWIDECPGDPRVIGAWLARMPRAG
ncbi:MAG: glycoside hydrolase family 19 protein [Amaricoccus sp.]